ncbi:MAG: flagellar FliJ family protein [Alphaproteobacteria bacterium]
MARDTMQTLIRLAGSEVDTARQELQKVLAREDQLNADLAALADEIARESDLARKQADMAGDFGVYMVRAKRRREILHRNLQDLQPEIEAARDKLAEAFANQKKYEIAKDNRDTAELADRNHKETQELDELGLNKHRRGG